MGNHYRQGDILIEVVKRDSIDNLDQFRELTPKNSRLIVAEGEATGHHHSVDSDTAKLFGDPVDGEASVLMPVGDGTELMLTHEEHDTVTLPAIKDDETFLITHQVEYQEKDLPRRVYD